MVWEEAWGIHSKLTQCGTYDKVAFHNTHILNIGCSTDSQVFRIFTLFFSWREGIFSLKNGKKGSPTQGGKPNLVTGDQVLSDVYCCSELGLTLVIQIKSILGSPPIETVLRKCNKL